PETSRSTAPSSSSPRPSGWPRRGGCTSGGSGESRRADRTVGARRGRWVRVPVLVLPAFRAGPFRRNRVDEEMADGRGVRSGMELLDSLLHLPVADGDPFVLPQVFGPRLHVVAFDEAPRFRRVRGEIPAEGSVPQPHPALIPDRLQEFGGPDRVDPVFHGHLRGPLDVLGAVSPQA